ncbi:MAG: hypothetical protein NVS4B9_21320 [Ktedonobacteraceae bacterium]
MNILNAQNPQESNDVVDLIERDPRLRESRGPFEFWYRLTAPPQQPLSASFELREEARQGRLTSTVLAIVAGSLIILAVPTSFALHNPVLLIVLCVLLFVVSIALFLNRIGRGIWGRWAIVVAMNVSLAISVITWTGGLTTNTLPILDIMVTEPILVALVLLPPANVFVVALFNVLFIAGAFYLLPHSSDLAHVMSFDAYEVVTRPLYLLIFVVGVTYPVMRNVLRAIALGDRAKEIAKVKGTMADKEAVIAQEKRQLDLDIERLVDVAVRAANGKLDARSSIPVSPNLVPLAGSLNTLLSRFRRALQSEYQLQHTAQAAEILIEALHQSGRTQSPLQLQRTGNPIIDHIASELLIEQSRSGKVGHNQRYAHLQDPGMLDER